MSDIHLHAVVEIDDGRRMREVAVTMKWPGVAKP